MITHINIAVFTVLAVLCLSASAVPGLTAPAMPAEIDLLKLKAKGAFPPLVKVTVEDPVYGKTMSYEGYPLADVLRTLPDIEKLINSGSEVVFHCLDGYTPSMPIETVFKKKGVIAVRQVGAKDGEDWTPIKKGDKTVSPAPFYLVWEDVPLDDHVYRWAYQLSKIEIVSSEEYFRAAYPKGSDKALEGFDVFRTYCIRCHSINLTGGTEGPELNAPNNVTEYWKPAPLRSFIKDAPRFRAHSKMPSFTELTDGDMENLLYYIHYMKGFKAMTNDPN